MTIRRQSIAATLACTLYSALAIAAAPPPKPTPKVESAEVAQPATDTQPAPNLREVAAHLQWYRGNYSRQATGFTFPIPPNFHLVESNEARNLEMATGHPDDPDVVAWAVLLSTPVTSPQMWAVRVRWRGDGLVAENAADLDGKVLTDAMSRAPEKRLANSGGTFKAFVEAPKLQDHVVSWVEERTPASGKGSLFDCHAVRLARRGILEFSIVGVAEPVRKTCAQTLSAFTEQLTFDDMHEYPAQPGTTAKAPYSLTGLVTQTK